MMAMPQSYGFNIQAAVDAWDAFSNDLEPEFVLTDSRLDVDQKAWLSILSCSKLYWEGLVCLLGFLEGLHGQDLFNLEEFTAFISSVRDAISNPPQSVAAAGVVITHVIPEETLRDLGPLFDRKDECLKYCQRQPNPPLCRKQNCW